MTDINNINSIAREIVTNLDKQDGKEDGKIEASIWNKFVCKKQGNEIHNYINTNSAVKSVIAYLKREVTKTGQAIEDVANEWLKNVGGGDKTEIDETRYNKSDDDLTMKPIILQSSDKYQLTSAEIEKMQKVVDKSLQLLMDIANGNYRYDIKKEKDPTTGSSLENRNIQLKDGREINLRLDEQKNGKYKIIGFEIFNPKTKESLVEAELDANEHYIVTADKDMHKANSVDDETMNSIFKLLQKIFGDDIEV